MKHIYEQSSITLTIYRVHVAAADTDATNDDREIVAYIIDI